jgi:hypothetical protein
MAVQISDGGAVPHATDYSDLLDLLVTFATAHGWTIVEDERLTAGKEHIILKGEGLAGTDEIFVGLRLYKNVSTDTYGLRLQGFTGYVAGVTFDAQPGAIQYDGDAAAQTTPTVPLWNDTIPYWFVVNARRIIVVAKISTVYEALYLGYLLPFALPGQWPYPLVVGGSAKGALRYDATVNHSHFVIPYNMGAVGTIRLRDAAGNWISPQIQTSGVGFNQSGTWPYGEQWSASLQGWRNYKKTPGSASDVWPVHPVIIFFTDAAQQYRGAILGIFDGISHIGGLENAVENTVTIGGDTFLVVRNVFRSTPEDFWSLLLA